MEEEQEWSRFSGNTDIKPEPSPHRALHHGFNNLCPCVWVNPDTLNNETESGMKTVIISPVEKGQEVRLPDNHILPAETVGCCFSWMRLIPIVGSFDAQQQSQSCSSRAFDQDLGSESRDRGGPRLWSQIHQQIGVKSRMHHQDQVWGAGSPQYRPTVDRQGPGT